MALAQDTNDLINEPTLEPILKNETSWYKHLLHDIAWHSRQL